MAGVADGDEFHACTPLLGLHSCLSSQLVILPRAGTVSQLVTSWWCPRTSSILNPPQTPDRTAPGSLSRSGKCSRRIVRFLRLLLHSRVIFRFLTVPALRYQIIIPPRRLAPHRWSGFLLWAVEGGKYVWKSSSTGGGPESGGGDVLGV